jgi:hypothetical protein
MAESQRLGLLGRSLVEKALGEFKENKTYRGGQYVAEYMDILAAMYVIGNAKVDQYGDFRLQDIRSWDREVWGAYWDIQRKFGRLENQIQLLRESKTMDEDCKSVTEDDLFETLIDQAVYCVRMIQILQRLEEKGMVPNASVSHGN